jgi:hypothetical protein
MENRLIEIHDSEVESISVENDGYTVLLFSAVYIHQSPGRPGIDAGIGWFQPAKLLICSAKLEGHFSELPADLYDGSIKLNGKVLENQIPIPLDFTGHVELTLQSVSGEVSIIGCSAKLELLGEPGPLEEIRP